MAIKIKALVVLSALTLSVWLALFHTIFFSPEATRAAAFTLVILSLWATGLIAEYLTALIFFTGAMLLAIAPPGIIFSGFSSGAFWLIFGGLILGVGINVTGLGTRIAVKAAHHLNRSYARVIAGLVFFGALFGFVDALGPGARGPAGAHRHEHGRPFRLAEGEKGVCRHHYRCRSRLFFTRFCHTARQCSQYGAVRPERNPV